VAGLTAAGGAGLVGCGSGGHGGGPGAGGDAGTATGGAAAGPGGVGGEGTTVGSGGAGIGGAGGSDAGSSYLCEGSYASTGSGSGGSGGAGGASPQPGTSATCVIGQTYCIRQGPHPDFSGPITGGCEALAPSCQPNPSCACVAESKYVNCTCGETNGKITVNCQAI
jgi:hypothetical protein